MRLVHEPKKLWPVLCIMGVVLVGSAWLQFLRSRPVPEPISTPLDQATDVVGTMGGQPDPVEALVKKNDPESISQLTQIASTSQAMNQYRVEAINALAAKSPTGADVVIAKLLVPSESLMIREAAANALEQMKCSRQCQATIRVYLAARQSGVKTQEEITFGKRPEALQITTKHNQELEDRLRNLLPGR